MTVSQLNNLIREFVKTNPDSDVVFSFFNPNEKEGEMVRIYDIDVVKMFNGTLYSDDAKKRKDTTIILFNITEVSENNKDIIIDKISKQ